MSSASSGPSPTRSRLGSIGLGLLIAFLASVAGYAALRESRKATVVAAAPSHADVHAFADRRPALSAAEERFSQGLWNIHADVRTAAVRMTFAGLSYIQQTDSVQQFLAYEKCYKITGGHQNCVAAHEPLSYTDKYPLTKNAWVGMNGARLAEIALAPGEPSRKK